MNTIIEMTRPNQGVKYVHTEGEMGYSSTLAFGTELMLAFKRNGEALPRAGGWPVRLVAPGEFGYNSVKFVQNVKFITEWEKGVYNKDLIGSDRPPLEPALD